MRKELSLSDIREKQQNGEIDSIVAVSLNTVINKDNKSFNNIITEKIVNSPTKKIVEVSHDGKNMLVIVDLE